MFPTVLFTAKKWEQTKCPSTDHTPAMKYLFSHKKLNAGTCIMDEPRKLC